MHQNPVCPRIGLSHNYGPLLIIDYIMVHSIEGYQNGTQLLGTPHIGQFLNAIDHKIARSAVNGAPESGSECSEVQTYN